MLSSFFLITIEYLLNIVIKYVFILKQSHLKHLWPYARPVYIQQTCDNTKIKSVLFKGWLPIHIEFLLFAPKEDVSQKWEKAVIDNFVEEVE
jgi:hypothetical protein